MHRQKSPSQSVLFIFETDALHFAALDRPVNHEVKVVMDQDHSHTNKNSTLDVILVRAMHSLE